MATTEDYRQMANRSAQLANGCAAPSVAQALLALALDYMALAAKHGQPQARTTSTCVRTCRLRRLILLASRKLPALNYAPQTGRIWA
jgi:hypothetical protein